MWESELPPEDALLRQGDLLKDVLLPRLKLPVEVAHAEGTAPSDGAITTSQGYVKDFLVVSQCCEIENGRFVAVALVRSTGRLNEQLRLALLADEPPRDDEEGGYVFDQFRLDPLAGLVEGTSDQFTVADLGQIVSFGGERQVLQRYRGARMTPEGRRKLRIKLGFYFSRVEDEDGRYLIDHGIPVGARP